MVMRSGGQIFGLESKFKVGGGQASSLKGSFEAWSAGFRPGGLI